MATHTRAISLLDLPDGVLARIFFTLTGRCWDDAVTGRCAERLVHGVALAHTCVRLYRVFRGTLSSVRLDGAENPSFDRDASLSALVRLSRPYLRDISLKWFERATLRPALSSLIGVGSGGSAPLRSLTLHGLGRTFSASDLATLFEGVGDRLQSISLVSIAAFMHGHGHGHYTAYTADYAILALASRCHHLQSFELSGTNALSHRALVAVWTSAGARLTSVDLHDVSHPTIGDNTLLELSARCPQLRALNVTGLSASASNGGVIKTGGISAQGMQVACSRLCSSLAELCVEAHDASHQAVSDVCAARVLSSCPLLTSVCFSKPCTGNGASAVGALTAAWARCAAIALGARLRKMSVYDTAGFGDAELCALVDACPRIESLGLRACPEVTSAGFARACTVLAPVLRSVDVSGSFRICDMGIRALGEHCGAGAGGGGAHGNRRRPRVPRKGVLEFAWLVALPQLTLGGLRDFLANSAAGLKDLNVAACGSFSSSSAARLIREHLAGEQLECVVLDNVVDIGVETTYEVVRRRQRPGAPVGGLRRQLERLRDECPNAVIVLERTGCVPNAEDQDCDDVNLQGNGLQWQP